MSSGRPPAFDELRRGEQDGGYSGKQAGRPRQTPIATLKVYPGRAAREKNPVLAETLAR
jgi:hypothetical protein